MADEPKVYTPQDVWAMAPGTFFRGTAQVAPGLTVTGLLRKAPIKVPAREVNRVSDRNLPVREANILATGSVVPVTFGRDRFFPKPMIYHSLGDSLLAAYLIGKGEIGSVANIYVDGIDVNDPTDGLAGKAGVDINTYVGNQTQNVDPRLGQISGFADNYRGFAYLVILLPRGVTEGLPRVEVEVEGLQIKRYDTGLSLSVGYTANPVNVLAYLLENKAGVAVNEASFTAAADWNNETIATDTKPRREIGMTFAEPENVSSLIDNVAAYTGCSMVWEGDEVKLVPYETRSTSKSYGVDDIEDLQLSKKEQNQIPTEVIVQYTDATDSYKQREVVKRKAGVPTTVPRRTSRVNLPGIHHYAQANREAVERLNVGLSDLTSLGFSRESRGFGVLRPKSMTPCCSRRWSRRRRRMPTRTFRSTAPLRRRILRY